MTLATFARRRFTNRSAKQRDWDQIHRIADRHFPALRNLFIAAWGAMTAALDHDALERELTAGSLPGVLVLLEDAWAKSTEATVRAPLQQLMQRIAEQSAQASGPGMQRLLGPQVSVAFNTPNPLVRDFIEQHSAMLIQGIGEETRQGIRSLLLDAMETGRGWRDIVPTLRETIGVTRQQAEALGKLRATAEAKGLKPAQIERLVAQKTRRYLQLRARTIARHESMVAASQGQMLLWRQLQTQGVLDPQQYRRHWIVTPDDRLCTAICRPIPGLNPGGVELHTAFASPVGPITGPPAHVLCRCAQVLRRNAERSVA